MIDGQSPNFLPVPRPEFKKTALRPERTPVYSREERYAHDRGASIHYSTCETRFIHSHCKEALLARAGLKEWKPTAKR